MKTFLQGLAICAFIITLLFIPDLFFNVSLGQQWLWGTACIIIEFVLLGVIS